MVLASDWRPLTCCSNSAAKSALDLLGPAAACTQDGVPYALHVLLSLQCERNVAYARHGALHLMCFYCQWNMTTTYDSMVTGAAAIHEPQSTVGWSILSWL